MFIEEKEKAIKAIQKRHITAEISIKESIDRIFNDNSSEIESENDKILDETKAKLEALLK